MLSQSHTVMLKAQHRRGHVCRRPQLPFLCDGVGAEPQPPPKTSKERCLSSALCNLLTVTAAPRPLLEMEAGTPLDRDREDPSGGLRSPYACSTPPHRFQENLSLGVMTT